MEPLDGLHLLPPPPSPLPRGEGESSAGPGPYARWCLPRECAQNTRRAQGNDLARRAVAQARRFGVEILTPQEVCGVRVEGPSRVLKLSDGGEVGCRALLIATGIAFRKLEVACDVPRVQTGSIVPGQ